MSGLSEKAQATRERILRAANELFHRRGYHATGLDRIIAEAGVTKGSFFYHFKNKEALAIASLDRHFDLLGEAMSASARQARSPLGTLIGILEFFADTISTQKGDGIIKGCYFGNFALELSSENSNVRRKLKSIFDQYVEAFRELLKRAAATGELEGEWDPDQLAAIIVNLLEGAILIDKTRQEPQEVKRVVQFVEGYLKDG